MVLMALVSRAAREDCSIQGLAKQASLACVIQDTPDSIIGMDMNLPKRMLRAIAIGFGPYLPAKQRYDRTG